MAVHLKPVFFVLFSVLLGVSAQAQDQTLAQKEATMDNGTYAGQTITVQNYKNAPFSEGGKYSNVAVLIPKDLKEVETIIWLLHGFMTDVSDGTFITMLSDALEHAAPGTILIAPQLAFMEKSGKSGRLAEMNGMSKLMREVLAVNNLTATDPEIIVVSYSGGYRAAIDCLMNNAELRTNQVVFADSWYWKFENAIEWYDEKPGERRMIIVYSDEKPSQGAKWSVNSLLLYGGERHLNISEDEFFAGKYYADEPIIIMDTVKKHTEVTQLIGPILSLLQKGGGHEKR